VGHRGPLAEQVASLLETLPPRTHSVPRRNLTERELALLGLQRQRDDLIDLMDDHRLLREGAVTLSDDERINLNERIHTQLNQVRLLGEQLQLTGPAIAPDLKPTATSTPCRMAPAVRSTPTPPR
jgi:hypothetical protein